MNTSPQSNVFSGGSAQSQIWNLNLVAPVTPALIIPYSSLAAGTLIMPTPDITIQMALGTGEDTSHSSGFDDIDEGKWALLKVSYQYQFGDLPGGVVNQYGYGWDSNFNKPNGRLNSATGARVYLDRSNSQTIDSESGTVAVREFVTSVVPTGAAQITLPAIEEKWWDTEADVERVAKLPAETYSVQSGTAPAAAGNAAVIAEHKITAGTDQGPALNSADSAQWSWAWIAAGAGAALLLLVLAWRFFIATGSRRPPATPGSDAAQGQALAKPSLPDHETQVAAALKAVEAACKRNDRNTAYTACCAWLKLRFGASALTPAKLEQVSPQLAEEFAAMERALYAEDKQAAWTGHSLWQAIAT